MGKIIRFPIYVDTTKSSETAYGLLNTLQSEVRIPTYAGRDVTVSEKALVRSISGMTFQTSGINLGTGAELFISAGIGFDPIFNGNTNVLQYRTLDLSGDGFDIVKTNGIIYLTSEQDQLNSNVGTVNMNNFNGGIFQESTFVDVSDFNHVNYKTLFRRSAARMAIGKIMVQPVTNFGFADGAVSGDIIYSIGTGTTPDAIGYNPTGIVSNISTLPAGQLTDFTYGNIMADKVEYVEFGTSVSNLNNITSYDDINIFRTVPDGVSPHSQGAFNVVIFYDMPDTPMSEYHTRNTIFMAGGRISTSVDDWGTVADDPAEVIGTMQKYNIDNGTCIIDFKLALTERNCRYALLQSSDALWYIGGQTSSYKSSIYKINPFTDTVVNTDNSLNDARANAASISMETKGYVFGGGSGSTSLASIVKLVFATSIFTQDKTTAYIGYNKGIFSKWCSSDYAYIHSGRSDETTLQLGTVYKFSMATETDTGATGPLHQAYSMASASDHSNSYSLGGHLSQSSTCNYYTRYSFATETYTLGIPLPMSVGGMACSTNASHTDMYLLGGNNNSALEVN